MKKLWLCILAVLAMGLVTAGAECTHSMDHVAVSETQHAWACIICGYREAGTESDHCGSCETPDVCSLCDASGVKITEENLHNRLSDEAYSSISDTHHARKCTKCGYYEREIPHWGYCDEPTVCEECGASGVTITQAALHYYSANYPSGWVSISDTQHDFVCLRCGYTNGYNVRDHVADCELPDVCKMCGAEKVALKLAHPIESRQYKDMGYKHQEWCRACGSAIGEEEYHEARCGTPTTCTKCDLENVTIDAFYIYHLSTSKTWVDLGNGMHQEICRDCGKEEKPAEHYASCLEPSTCLACKTENLTIENVDHRHTGYLNLGDMHQYACMNCWTPLADPEPHRASCTNPTTCAQYGCEAEGITCAEEDMIHYGNHVYLDRTSCQFQCDNCDYAMEKQSHFVVCTRPDGCADCNSIDIDLDAAYVEHMGETGYKNLGDTHQQYCMACGYEGKMDKHIVVCNDETKTCLICGAADVPDAELSHGESKYVNCGTSHQAQCSRCGKGFAKYSHYVMCSDKELPATCVACAAELQSLDGVRESHRSNVENQGENHVYRCQDCDYVEEEEHYVSCDRPGYCWICSSNVTTDNIKHAFTSGVTEFTVTAGYHEFNCVNCGVLCTDEHYYYDGTNECAICKYIRITDLPGDADNDAQISLADGLAVLLRVAGGSLSINELNADVNGDETVDSKDALLILQYAAGWDVELK